MLLVTLLYMGILFWFGNPGMAAARGRATSGLLLMGGCFISVGLLISSLTKNQIVAGALTFAVFLMLWVINWMADQSGPIDAGSPDDAVDHRSLRRFRQRRHRHEAPGLLPELHHLRPVPDGQVGRQRTVAR